LTAVIKKAKMMEYEKRILNSHNKIKTTWGIINNEIGRNSNRVEIKTLKIYGKNLNNKQALLVNLINILSVSQIK
jgi:hypothetical protein